MKDTFFERLVKNKPFLIMLIPGVAYVLLFAYIPMGGIILAFKKYSYAGGIFGSPWIGLKNFEFFFKSGRALLVSRNTVLYNLLFIAFNTVLQMAVAIFLTEVKSSSFRKVSQSFMFLPYFISWVVVSVIAFNILSYDFGFINVYIAKAGLGKINFYNNGSYWPVILTLFGAWKAVGYGSVMYLAAIMGIDTEVYEAAAMDGVGVFRRIFSITIPLMLPTVMILLLLSIGGIFKGNFDMFYNLIGNNGALHGWTDVIDTFTFRALITNNDFGMSSAVGLYQSVLCFATVLLANRLVRLYNEDYSLF